MAESFIKLRSFILIFIISFTSEIYPQSISLSEFGNDQSGRYSDSASYSQTTLTPFSNIGNNIIDSFTGWDNILLQAAGILSTAAISSSGMDSHVSAYFRDNQSYNDLATPAVIAGSTLPITAGAFLYIYGKLHQDNRMVGASFAVLQAGLVTVAYISVLKGITGRAHPDQNDAPSDRADVSRRFNFGLIRSGIYRGWPSGHVGGTMAVASALSNFYSEKTWLKVLSYSWVGYTMASVSIFHKGTMHWLSDAVAAGFMTYSIGRTAGSFYRGEPHDKENVKFRLLPIADSNYSGIYFSYSF